MEPKMKYFYPQVKAVDSENRRITVCISKDEIDRHNERIEIDAIAEALKGYAPNPVVLGDHQHRLSTGKSSVIGHAPPEAFKVLADEVDMDIIFSTTENAETYWVNFRDGHQKAISIGFIDCEMRFEEIDGRKIYVTTKLELLEVSCVAVGANRGALVKVAGMFDRQLDAETEEKFARDATKQISELKTFCEENFENLKSLITDSERFAESLMLGDDSDPSSPAGDEKMAEQFDRIENQITLIGG